MWSRKHFIILISALAILMALSGCKSKKSMVSSGKTGSISQQNIESPNHQITESSINQDYRTLKAKATLSLPTMNIKIKATVSVEMGKNIMISLQPLLGLEMYRIVCTQEHIIFIDKLTHSYMAETYKNFTDKNYNLNYDMVEALLCNRLCDPLQENYKNLETVNQGETTVYRKAAPNYYVEFVTQSGSIYRTTFASNDGSQYVMADYSAFTAIGRYTFPMSSVCNIQSKQFPLSFNVNFEEVTFDGDVNIVETFPSGYNKLSLETLTQSLFK